MPTPNRPASQTKYTEQNMGNTSFDEDFGVNAVEGLVYNSVTGNMDRMVQPATSTSQTDGSQVTKISNVLITEPFDYIGATYPDTSTEVYTYKLGGASGTGVGVITVIYSDAVTKLIITSVTKT